MNEKDFILFQNVVEQELGKNELYRLLKIWKEKKDEINS